MNIEKQAADLFAQATAAGYEKGFHDGIKAALNAVSQVARANGSAPAPKSRKPRKAKNQPSKMSVARGVISELVATGGKVTKDVAVSAAREKDDRVTPSDVANALTAMVKAGAVRMVDPGVYVGADAETPRGE